MARGDDDIEEREMELPEAPDGGATADGLPEDHSLFEDIEATIADGRTYVEAELAFQKSRAAYAGSHAKSIAIYGALAALLVLLALVAVTIGVLLALTPMIGPWLATLAVTGGLLLCAVLCLLVIKSRAGKLGRAFADDET